MIDDTGIRFNPRKGKRAGAAASRRSRRKPRELPVPPAPGRAAGAAGTAGQGRAPSSDGSVHIELPPQIGEELSNAIEEAVDDMAEQKVTRYHNQASTWFKSFVSLLLLALFATKALMGGKKRAEARNPERQRRGRTRIDAAPAVRSASMQMMQAQVEPHFLFNTLASVEYLIETNPPRASAMQRSLIQYLRAVLPQMRDNAVVTNLGREADMVKAYLNLLKMRMEERLTVDMQIPDEPAQRGLPADDAAVDGRERDQARPRMQAGRRHPEDRRRSGRQQAARDRHATTASASAWMPSDGTGLGLPTIRERLKLLHGDQGQLHIAANSPSGVIATIEVPYQVSK